MSALGRQPTCLHSANSGHSALETFQDNTNLFFWRILLAGPTAYIFNDWLVLPRFRGQVRKEWRTEWGTYRIRPSQEFIPYSNWSAHSARWYRSVYHCLTQISRTIFPWPQWEPEKGKFQEIVFSEDGKSMQEKFSLQRLSTLPSKPRMSFWFMLGIFLVILPAFPL